MLRIWLLLTSLAVTLLLGHRAVSSANAAPVSRSDAAWAAAQQQSAIERLYADQRVAARRAVFWLVTTHQNRDGGYTSFFSTGANQAPSDIGGTAGAMLALAAAGYPSGVPYSGRVNAPLDYLSSVPEELGAYAAADSGQAAILIHALAAAGADPRNFAGQNLVEPLKQLLGADGDFSTTSAYTQSLAMMALAALNEPLPQATVDYLIGLQFENGSWDDGYGNLNNADATAMAIMALIAAGQTPDAPAVQRAVEFLKEAQLESGGWEYTDGWGGNANSTALVIQALSAAGEDWYSTDSSWTRGGRTPLQTLLGFQGATGAFQADYGQGPFDDFLATTQGILGVSGRPFPLPAYGEAVRRGLVCLENLQDEASGGWEQFSGGGSSAGGTARAIQAIAAAGDDVYGERWAAEDGRSAPEVLEDQAADYIVAGRGGRAGLVLQAVVAAGQPTDAADFAGYDLPLQVSSYLSPTGQYDDTTFGIFDQAEAMLGLLSAGTLPDPNSVDFLMSTMTDGDWGNSDSNGQALQVLGAIGRRAPAATLAVLHRTQSPEGGWSYGDVFNPSSSAEVVVGLLDVGLNPFGPEWSTVVNGRLTNAADAVAALQSDDGCWASPYFEGADPFSTTDALMLLASRPNWGAAATLAPTYGGGY